MTPWKHAVSSAKKFGGEARDYHDLHAWFDESKAYFPSIPHRALRHHTLGILEAERIFGPEIVNSRGRGIPTRLLGEQHLLEDCGRLPTVADWLRGFRATERWMGNVRPEGDPRNTQKRNWQQAVCSGETEKGFRAWCRENSKK